MNRQPLSTIEDNELMFAETGGRSVRSYRLTDVVFAQNAQHYPDVCVFSRDMMYNPIDERIMSLSDLKIARKYTQATTSEMVTVPVFFMIYNFDNYFHFLYDTLPYVLTYRKLKKTIPNLKLLVQHPPLQSGFCPFVMEFFRLLGIGESDFLLVNAKAKYSEMYFSESYTHGTDSAAPPLQDIYTLYREMADSAGINRNFPKNIYVSRRTWLHGDTSNIGTDYTSRRVMVNETELVQYLGTLGYEEVFSEKLTTLEKISMFAGAKNIVGAIGGGVANAVFSRKANLHVLISPTFMDKHQRFKHVFATCTTNYYECSRHIDSGKWKRYMRVSVPTMGIVGEIERVGIDGLEIGYHDAVVAGWNQKTTKVMTVVPEDCCVALDSGLNSPWEIDMKELRNAASLCV